MTGTQVLGISMATDSRETPELAGMLCGAIHASRSGSVLAAEGAFLVWELLSVERSGLQQGHPQSSLYPVKVMVQRPSPFASIRGDAEGHPGAPMGRGEASVLTASRLSSSLCPVLLPSPPLVWMQVHPLLTNLHLRACFLRNPPHDRPGGDFHIS